MVKIANIVATGLLGQEIDLEALLEDIPAPSAYITGPGLYVQFSEEDPILILSKSGKYTITGASSEEELIKAKEDLITALHTLSIAEDNQITDPEIQNIVCTDDLGFDIDLNVLAIHLNLNYVEYEPEQFSGLIYRPPHLESVLLIFGSGKVVITGVRDLESAEEAFKDLENDVNSLLRVE